MISEAILIPKIYARLQEIASNFSKFSGGGHPDAPPAVAPSALGSGLRPLTGPSFQKFLDPPLIIMKIMTAIVTGYYYDTMTRCVLCYIMCLLFRFVQLLIYGTE